MRSFALRLLVAALAIVAGASALHAQSTIEKCNCKYVTIRVAKNVACKVNVVLIYPTRPSPLVTVAPGTEVQVPCEDGTTVTVVDCHFHKNLLGPDGCVHGFPADVDCCIDACLTKDADGCALLDITASATKCRCN